jgi:hypothetical protein
MRFSLFYYLNTTAMPINYGTTQEVEDRNTHITNCLAAFSGVKKIQYCGCGARLQHACDATSSPPKRLNGRASRHERCAPNFRL